jgi:hypothetical protein
LRFFNCSISSSTDSVGITVRSVDFCCFLMKEFCNSSSSHRS